MYCSISKRYIQQQKHMTSSGLHMMPAPDIYSGFILRAVMLCQIHNCMFPLELKTKLSWIINSKLVQHNWPSGHKVTMVMAMYSLFGCCLQPQEGQRAAIPSPKPYTCTHITKYDNTSSHDGICLFSISKQVDWKNCLLVLAIREL